MNQSERRQILIRSLLKERPEYQNIEIPHNGNEQKKLLRSLMNIRMAAPVSEEFQWIQDAYLQEENRDRGIVELSALAPVQNEIYLWRGDTADSAKIFVANILKSGHESVIEHENISVRIICDRGVSHEIVRHRIASYSQESTRYCNYSKNKFGNELTVIKPLFWEEGSKEYQLWHDSIKQIEDTYNQMISIGVKPQEARSILPNSLKTEIVVTMNPREWRHFFKLRTSNRAHPQMKEIADIILKIFRQQIPIIFDDIASEN